jgi:hypothetical protein
MCSRALVAIALVAALGGRADAGDPRRTWWTIETDHFVITYYDPLGDVAQRVAQVAERAHRNLAPALRHTPENKTQLIILDDVDGANGFASVLPRNRITLYATAPIGESALNDHDDWLYGLVGHEYTHILHLDSIGGPAKLVNKVLGKTWAPNQIQPRWVIEGLATYQESKRSSSGRVRSNQFDMLVRSAVLGHKDLDLDAVTSGPYEFPRGNAAYLYGSKFLTYVFDRFGDDKVAAMSWAAGTDPTPFAVNRPIARATGEPFDALWEDWKVWLRDRYTLQLEAVERAGRREGRRITFDTEGHGAPEYTADGKELVWLANDGISQLRLRAVPVGGNVGDARDVLAIDRVGGWSMLDDGSVVYEQTWQHRQEYDFQELVYWDAATGVKTRLTHGKRARDPQVSPDGKRVAFVQNGESHFRLAMMELAPDAEIRVLYEGGRFDQAYTPAWSPDGAKLVFSAWRKGGLRDLMLYDLASGSATELTRDRAIDGDPAWSPDGRYVYFSSDRTGIYNIYAYELATGAIWQVTNVVGGAFDPAVSPDGTRLAYQGFDADGYDLFEIELDPAHWTAARPYVDERPPPTDVADDEVRVLGPRPYRPLETLAPNVWSAELLADSAIGTAVTVRTSGSDVAGVHAWNLATTISLDDGTVNVGGAYGYSQLRFPLRLTAGRTISERNGYRVDGVSMPYREEVLSATLATGLPTRRSPGSTVSLSIDFDVDYQHIVEEPPGLLDPSDATPRAPLSNYFQDGVALRGSWSSTRGYAETEGTVEGHELSGSIRYDDPVLGATNRLLSLSWSYRWFHYVPWARDGSGSIGLRYGGGARLGDIDRGSSFTLGGTPEQDVVGALISTARIGSTGYLRGYEPRVVQGDTFHLANLELRQRLWQIEEGLETLPLFVKRLHVAGLADAGTATDAFDASDVKWSLGAALRLDVVLGFYAPGSLEVGYAHGFSDEGIDETWLLMTTTL